MGDPYTGGLHSNHNLCIYFSQFCRRESSRSRNWRILCPVKACVLAYQQSSSCVSTRSRYCSSAQVTNSTHEGSQLLKIPPPNTIKLRRQKHSVCRRGKQIYLTNNHKLMLNKNINLYELQTCHFNKSCHKGYIKFSHIFLDCKDLCSTQNHGPKHSFFKPLCLWQTVSFLFTILCICVIACT